MKPAAFTYHRAHDVADAVGLLADLAAAGEDPKLIAGGQSLMPMMNFRLARPSALVDLGTAAPAAGADGARRDDGGDPHARRAASPTTPVETAGRCRAGFAVLARAMRWVGHLPIRSAGHGRRQPRARRRHRRVVPARAAARRGGRRRGPGGPARDPRRGACSTASTPPRSSPTRSSSRCGSPGPRPHAALSEFARRHGDFAIVDAAVALDLAGEHGSGRTGGRVVLGGVAPAPVRVPEAEAVLAAGGTPGPELFAAVADAAAAAIDPPDDPQVTAAYRRRLTRTLVADACAQAAGGPR